MTVVWLMRHGEAVDVDLVGSDDLRPLTPRGIEQVSGLGRWLHGRVQPPEEVWHSPLLRTQETAEFMAKAFGREQQLKEVSAVAPGMSPEGVLKLISSRPLEVVLLVGHQPDIGHCISEYIGGGRLEISPGTIAAIRFPSQLALGRGQLLWVCDPWWFGG
jgi:phosphohistidine phosphatase